MQRREALKRITWISGGALSAPIAAGILQGCQADSSSDWMPSVLTEDQVSLVAEICETIIPATDTPGAKDALVHRYVDIMLKDIFEEKDKNRFLTKLDEFAQDAQTQYGKSFVKCESEQRIEHLKSYEKAARNNTNPVDTPFFTTMKQLTLSGFFTSEVGATQVLRYVAVPGRYEGCVPLEEGQNAWAV